MCHRSLHLIRRVADVRIVLEARRISIAIRSAVVVVSGIIVRHLGVGSIVRRLWVGSIVAWLVVTIGAGSDLVEGRQRHLLGWVFCDRDRLMPAL